MFHAIEKFRRPAQVLMGLIAVSFVGFGLVGFQLSNNKDYIVRVGNQVITRQDVDRAMDNMQQAGGAPSRETVFQTLLDQAYLMEGAQRLGIVVSDTQIKQSIVDNPIFHDASGKFDSALFQSIIQRTYGNEEFFMREERQRLTVLSLLNTLGHGATSDAQALQVINAQLAPRYARSVPIVADAFASKVAVNDAALQKYYDEHKNSFGGESTGKIMISELKTSYDLTEDEMKDPDGKIYTGCVVFDMSTATNGNKNNIWKYSTECN